MFQKHFTRARHEITCSSREPIRAPAVVKGVSKRGQKKKKRSYYITADSLRSRRLEVVGVRKNEPARGRHACVPLAHPFFAGPVTQAKARFRRRTFHEPNLIH